MHFSKIICDQILTHSYVFYCNNRTERFEVSQHDTPSTKRCRGGNPLNSPVLKSPYL